MLEDGVDINSRLVKHVVVVVVDDMFKGEVRRIFFIGPKFLSAPN